MSLLKRIGLSIVATALFCVPAFAQYNPKAKQIAVDTTNFGHNLSSSDSNLQHALDTLDDLIAGASGDITDVGSCSTGACFTSGSPSTNMYFNNATSGTVKLQTVTGALGSAVVSLPAATTTLVGKDTTDTLTNKTLTSPVINTPTGIVKGDVGLGNVDNTSDATKNAASVTLTNHTLDDSNTITQKDANFILEDDGTTSKKFQFQLSSISTSTTRTWTVPDATSTFVGTDTTQTLTNKTLTSPAITSPTGIVKGDVGLGNVDNTSDASKNAASVTLTNHTIDNTNTVTHKDTLFTLQDDGDTSKQLRLQLSGITTATTRTLTVPDANTTIVGTDTTQTLTNKTLTSPVINTPTGIVKGDISLGNVDNTSDVTKNAASVTLTNHTLDVTNTVTLKDTLFTVQDDGDTSKQLKFQLSGITTATTRTITIPDASGTVTLLGNGSTGSGNVVLATSPSLTTPTLGVATITSINKMAVTAPATSSTLAVADSKTFTASNTLTLAGTDSTTITFQGTDTYVGRGTTDTLTNKTLTSPVENTPQLTLEDGNGSAPTANGRIKYDRTAKNIVVGDGTTTQTFIPTGTLTDGKACKYVAGTGMVCNVTVLNAGTLTDTKLCTWDAGSSSIVCNTTASGGGDFSSNTSTSVDSEIVLFSSTGGKTGKRSTGSGLALLTSGVLSVVTAPSGTVVGNSDTQTLTNKTLDNTDTVTLKDTLFTLQDDGDTTKQARFQLSGITTSTTRTYTLPDASDTFVLLAATQTLTNKTLTSPTLTTPVINGASSGTGVATAATASTLALRDSSGNITANNHIQSYTTTTTAAGTTTLTVASTYLQYFTGSTTQTLVLPVASTLVLGHQFMVFNNSTGAVTVQSSGANNIIVVPASSWATFTCILTSGTTAASWDYKLDATLEASGKSLSVSNTLTLAGTDATTMTFPSTSATIARTDAANTFTGHQTIEGVATTGATGTGNLVFATSPSLTTPTLGVASATTVNKVTLTTPATGSTLTIIDGKTLTVNNSIQLSGTDSTTMTFPSTSATIARTDAANTFTGHQTVEGVTSTGATGTGKFVFDGTPTLVTPNIGVATATSVNGSANFTKGYIFLPIQSAKLPSSNPARTDGSAQPWYLLFDASTSQSAQWQFIMPQDYGSALSARLIFSMATTQSGTLAVIWRTYIMKDTPSSDAEDTNSAGYASANSVTHTLASNQTAGYARVSTVTQTNADSVAAGDFVQFKIDRDAANGSDTGTGDARLLGVMLEYTKS